MIPPGKGFGRGNGAPRKSGAQTCPVCGKPIAKKHRPFCSNRCANVDLNRWLSDRYVIKGSPAEDEDDIEESP